jgi:hypothetical protein
MHSFVVRILLVRNRLYIKLMLKLIEIIFEKSFVALEFYVVLIQNIQFE